MLASPEGTRVYLALLDEGAEVYRPVVAVWQHGNTYRIVSENPHPEVEHWSFDTGDLVRCRERSFSDGSTGLVAFEKVRDE